LKYAYRVRDISGRKLKGMLEAENKTVLIENLLRQGYYILSLKEIKASKSNIEVDLFSKKVFLNDLLLMSRQLSTMISSGLPIPRCLRILGEQTANKRLKKAISQIQKDIEEGLALWEAIGKHPAIFSNVYINMVRAGELAGSLEEVLDRLSEYIQREEEFHSKLRSASIYPVIVIAFTAVLVFLIITLVLPGFAGVFQATGAEIPLPTRLLLNIGLFLQNSILVLIIGTIILLFLIKCWAKTDKGRLFIDKLCLHLPLLGRTISHMTAARFSRTMGMLLRSGIPVLEALELAEDTVGNTVISRAISRARSSISEGDSITLPLENTGVFEPMFTQMIAVGEETGTLDQTLIRISDYFERELTYMINSMMAVIEPLMILAVALVVGGVVLAVLLPIFSFMTTVA
jgi:type IV pilus assembly protein PilC